MSLCIIFAIEFILTNIISANWQYYFIIFVFYKINGDYMSWVLCHTHCIKCTNVYICKSVVPVLIVEVKLFYVPQEGMLLPPRTKIRNLSYGDEWWAKS